MAHDPPRPVGGSLVTSTSLALGAVAALGAILVLWRFAVGLGPTTGMNDGYPFGLWIAFDVVTGTALACGGYAMALMVYVLNRGQYHPLVRPAILTSALGYTIAGLSVVVDVGRPWLLWKVPFFPNRWNASSVMLEVALCVMSYVAVLWLEFSPAFLERLESAGNARWARRASVARRAVETALPFVIALGLLLPTMHQSSLGSLMLLAELKLPELWRTPMLPLLFLVSCIAMGFAVVVLESGLSVLAFKRTPETPMLASLFRAACLTTVLYLVLRFGDLAARGVMADAFVPGKAAALFWAEMAVTAAPLAYLVPVSRQPRLGSLFRAALLMAAAGAFYRFNVYLVAFDPGPGWAYFPAVPEVLVTVGLIAAEVLAYVTLVRVFPVLGGGGRPPLPQGA